MMRATSDLSVNVSGQSKICPKPTTESSEMSYEKFYQGKPIDPYAFRRCFPDRWSAYLRAHFRSSLEVALFFDVTERTAANWLEGSNRPSGDKVAIAAMMHPAGFKEHLTKAA